MEPTKARQVRLALLMSMVCLAGVFAGAATPAMGASAITPPTFLFKPGFNLSKAAPLAAIQEAGGRSYVPGRFTRGTERTCFWVTEDERSNIFLTVFPAGAKEDGMPLPTLMKLQLAHGILKPVRLPGASIAGTSSAPEQHMMSVWAVYQKRVVWLQLTEYLTSPAAAKQRAIALMRLVTHTQ